MGKPRTEIRTAVERAFIEHLAVRTAMSYEAALSLLVIPGFRDALEDAGRAAVQNMVETLGVTRG